MDRVAIKREARQLTSTNKWNIWKPALLLGLISGVIGAIVGILNLNESAKAVFNLILDLALLPASVGYMAYVLKLVRGESFSLNDLKEYYPQFLTIIAISILTGIFVFLWSILFIIPGIIAALGYSMVFYILVDNKDLSPMEALRKSKELMNGHKWEFFVFQLSFLGWEILATLTFGILYIWLFPYMTIATTKFYDELAKSNQ